MINSSPVNEKVWENINSMIFTSSGINVYSNTYNNHLSGMDIDCSLGKISNKSTKYAKMRNSFEISSYRLTTVCSERNVGTPSEIIGEINRRKNFDYYSIIARDELTNPDKITYNWLFIPSNYHLFDPASYMWSPKIGKLGKNIDRQVGWCTNSICGSKMVIKFNMSSQLWIHIKNADEINNFIIASTEIEKQTPLQQKYNYISIYEMYRGDL